MREKAPNSLVGASELKTIPEYVSLKQIDSRATTALPRGISSEEQCVLKIPWIKSSKNFSKEDLTRLV